MSMYKVIDSDTKKETTVELKGSFDRFEILKQASEKLGVEVPFNKIHSIFIIN